MFAVAGDAIDEPFLRAVIEGDVARDFAAAEDADFAHALGADAAHGEIRNTAVGEAESRVRDVRGLAQNGNANTIHVDHRRFHEREHDIEIVNH